MYCCRPTRNERAVNDQYTASGISVQEIMQFTALNVPRTGYGMVAPNNALCRGD